MTTPKKELVSSMFLKFSMTCVFFALNDHPK